MSKKVEVATNPESCYLSLYILYNEETSADYHKTSYNSISFLSVIKNHMLSRRKLMEYVFF